jgi:hypothetical protein
MPTRIQLNDGNRFITIHGNPTAETVQNILAQKIREEEGQASVTSNEAEPVLELPSTMAFAPQPPQLKKPLNLPRGNPPVAPASQQPMAPQQPPEPAHDKTFSFRLVDGTHLVVTGPSAQEVINHISSQYHLTANEEGLVTSLTSEEPLLLPSMNFDKQSSSVPTVNDDEDQDEEEPVLALPSMNFARRAA